MNTIAEYEQRIKDLLDANNRDLQRARDAEAKVKTYEAQFKELTEPTHRHVKTGGLYRVIGEGRIEADLAAVTVYVSEKGEMWVRPTAEFNDGRFEDLHFADRLPIEPPAFARPTDPAPDVFKRWEP
jgi:hypothetical protein